MSRHAEWLSLIEISGPFLAVPVLNEVFPQGFEELDAHKRKRLRQAYDEWREAWDLDDPQFAKLHRAWIEEVLARGLELDEDGAGDVLKSGGALPKGVHAELPEYGIKISPDFAVVDEQRGSKPLLLIKAYDAETDLEAVLKEAGWASSPAERMVHLCRATGCRLGLVTNGERWMLVDAPVGAVTTFASWYARIWMQEPITFQAFVSLLGVRRFFLDETEQLPALLDRSLKHQDEVTDALGEQVRRAVEVLIQSLDRADVDRNRELLVDVTPAELYEAGLTVMMRLVFLLCAEERGLLLMGDERYEANYAISTLRMQLRAEAEEILERRMDAWSRLLATFRAVYGGIDHENLFMPALGGSLFDPDRFPFLEGRGKKTSWKNNDATPLPIDNRTVLLLLDAIQSFDGRTLSYRALDVEQIGYVYEGLLERTVKRTAEVTLELDATKSSKKPWVTLGEIEAAKSEGKESLEKILCDRSGSSNSRIHNDLARDTDDYQLDRLLTACHGDQHLRDQIKPLFHLLRTDPWGYPIVYRQNSFIVTTGSDRRETGTHYTPKSLTESIVTSTLEPVVYVGVSEGRPREEWRLKSSREILDIKVCDPAMGSGAFLVQVCRYLGEKLVEAWLLEESAGKVITVGGKSLDNNNEAELIPSQLDERMTIARRLVSEHCLYGVDINPLAVELAKLSIWLVTLAKGRPFGFLDHNLRSGDSLLGIYQVEQLTQLRMDTESEGSYQLRMFSQNIEAAVNEAIELRKLLRATNIRDINDVHTMAYLDQEARKKLKDVQLVADAMVGEALRCSGDVKKLGKELDTLAIMAGEYLHGNEIYGEKLARQAKESLKSDQPEDKPPRIPVHWCIEFPEVFQGVNKGFDAFVGNPPFLGGKRIAGAMGRKYLNYLISLVGNGVKGSADLVVFFFLRSEALLQKNKCIGMIACNSIAEGGNRVVGLEQLKVKGLEIYQAVSSDVWPGSANVVTSRVCIYKGKWCGERILNETPVSYISSYLTNRDNWAPKKLPTNGGIVHQGNVTLGSGFILSIDETENFLESDSSCRRVILPYLRGQDINRDPCQKATEWVINFWDWPIEKARKQFPKVFSHIERTVPGERKNMKSMGGSSDTYWLHLWSRSELYHQIGRGNDFDSHPFEGWKDKAFLERVIVFARAATKYCCFSIVPNIYVYSDSLCVVSKFGFGLFATLSSDIHCVWAWEHGSKMKQDLRYSHGDVFETFPFAPGVLEDKNETLNALGEKFFETRAKILRDSNKGMTRFYNDYHDPSILTEALNGLRSQQVEINNEVLKSYGFGDLDLEYGFHQVSYLPKGKNIRFTMSEAAREEVLYRLAMLNKKRYEELTL